MAENDVVLPRFFKLFLSGTTSESMEIPMSFTEYLKDPLPETAKLQSASGRNWTVSFKKIRDRAYFTSGWSKFAEDHELKDGEYLTFVFDGERTFEVSVFGRWSCKETRAVTHTVEISDSDDEEDTSISVAPYVAGSSNLEKGAVAHTVQSSDSDEEDTSMPDAAPAVAGSSNLGDMNTIFFKTHLKNRKFELLIPKTVVNDHGLTFGETITYIDDFGTKVGNRMNWLDDRIGFKGWQRICRRNKFKEQDEINCEMFHNMNLVHSIKIHSARP